VVLPSGPLTQKTSLDGGEGRGGGQGRWHSDPSRATKTKKKKTKTPTKLSRLRVLGLLILFSPRINIVGSRGGWFGGQVSDLQRDDRKYFGMFSWVGI